MSSNPVFVAFDVETTGLVPGVDRIVELAAIAFQGGEVLEGFSRLISPGVPMLPAASRVTGITDDLLAGAPTAADALPDFLCVLRRGTPVAHNAVFDVGFVCDELERAGLPAPECPVLDTRGLARRAFPGQFSYGLANLVRELKIIPPGAHRALADADSCRQLFQRCAGKLGSGKTPALAELIQASGRPLDFSVHAPRLPRTARLLRQAMAGAAMVDICYRSADGTLSSRRIKPLAFSLVGGAVAVVALCTLRNDTRTFFLDSITEARHAL